MTNNFVELWNLIFESFNEGNYELTLKYLNEYIKLENVGINEQVLSKYIDCNIALENYNEAKKSIKLMEKLYKDICSKFVLAIKNIDCFNIEEAKKIVEKYKMSDKAYYNIAKELILYGEYDLAQEYLNRCIRITDKEHLKTKALKHLYKIHLHQNEGFFLEQNYNYFKSKGNKLEPGYVVYAKISDEEYKNQDPVCDRRPYMIWKMNKDEMYCFPITKRLTNSRGEKCLYTLYGQYYINFNSDRNIKDSIVTIKESEITKIYEKIKPQDFVPVVRNLYPSLYFWPEEKRKSKKHLLNKFVEDMNIEINDVIIFMNRETRKKSFYYVLDIDENGYKVREIYHDREYKRFKLVNNKEEYISKDELVYSIVKLDLYEKSELNYDIEKSTEKKLILK